MQASVREAEHRSQNATLELVLQHLPLAMSSSGNFALTKLTISENRKPKTTIMKTTSSSKNATFKKARNLTSYSAPAKLSILLTRNKVPLSVASTSNAAWTANVQNKQGYFKPRLSSISQRRLRKQLGLSSFCVRKPARSATYMGGDCVAPTDETQLAYCLHMLHITARYRG
jgi:hypothetical protein